MTDKDIAQATQCGGSPKAGEIYRHYKGGLYTVLARAIHEATHEPLVIYQSNVHGYIWARTLANWSERVQDRPRFTRVSE